MKLFGRHGVLKPRHIKERNSYISSSLTSSADLVERLISSSTNDPSRALVMRFNRQWLDPYCPVYKWYRQQRQVRSSTQFTSIEHWKTNQAPFYHEYLIIRLDTGDGDVCRVERMGEGSRRDAIKRLGCTAYDIIQCFSSSEYASNPISKEPAELICRVDFPRAFDLQDILAICWSIQKTPRCAGYTLQRYNCYFLCLTTLAVLARRVGRWEGMLDTETSWSGLVNHVISYLQQTRCEDPDEYIGLGICDLIEPNQANPRGTMLDALHGCLSHEGLTAWGTFTSTTLWMKDLEEAITRSLASHVEDAFTTLLGSNSTWSKMVQDILNFDRNDADKLRAYDISHEFQKAVEHSFGLCLCQSILEAARSTDKMRQMYQLEYQPALWCRMIASSLAAVGYVCGVFGGAEKSVSGQGGWSEALSKNWQQSFNKNPLGAFSFTRLAFLGLFDDDMDMVMFMGWGLRSYLHGVPISAPLQQTLGSNLCATRIAKLRALVLLFDRRVWIESLQVCVGRAIGDAAKSHITRMESTSESYVIRMTYSHGGTRKLSARQLHDYIRERIHMHAVRVESIGLAAAQLVEIGIDLAMSEVWKGLPSGYGGMYGRLDLETPSRQDVF
ncbi:unnamed protein product [Rhizoctonia solani]|uniref:Uncharacterized protein n=1 Tax=Rhizoctonia solani TaxID=456999 RepID=A0A8H3A9K7_9AGAM|nr:unnamed protein product [Rhizoctonia solani]